MKLSDCLKKKSKLQTAHMSYRTHGKGRKQRGYKEGLKEKSRRYLEEISLDSE
jgi:hypothetical protein